MPRPAVLTRSVSLLFLPLHREAADDLSNWQTKEDLRSYLTAMSLLGSSKNGGGGRTFNKEKHNFFDNISHFKETLDAARQKKKDSFHAKLKRLGVKPHTKQAAYLWQQMNERHDGNEVAHTAGPPPPAATIAGGGAAGEEKEGGDGHGDGDSNADMTAEEEESLRVAAREDDEANAQAAAATVDSAAMAHLALQRLSSTSGTGPHHTRAQSSLGAHTHDTSSTTPYGVPIPGRKGGDPISAPRVFRKAEWELEEEAEERAEAAAAEAARRAAEEQRKKEQAERDSKKSATDSEAPQSQGQSRRATGGADRERVSSATAPLAAAANDSGDNSHRNSRVGSASATPHISRRGSLLGAAGALRVIGATPTKRPLQILPDRQAVAATNLAASQAQPMSDEMFAAEASRIMGMVLATPMIAMAPPAPQQPAPESDRFGAIAAAAAASSVSTVLSPRDQSSSRPMSGPLGRRALAAATSQLEEIERWNARTPDTARSLAGDQQQQVANLAHKSILSLAAEKLGVHSMDSIGGGGGTGSGTPAFRPSASPASLTANYRASFESRLPSSAATPFGAASRNSPRPASASATGTPRRRATNFGHSATSATTNLHSLNSAIEFREPRPRKELVALGRVLDPADVFSSVDKDMGSTLMSFEQLHVANRALAEEARKRTELAEIERAAHDEVVQRKAQKQAEEPDPIDVLRAKLADKSRTRTRTRRDGSPSKSLHTSSSTGHLSSRAAAAHLDAAAAALVSPSRTAAGGARRPESASVAGAASAFASPTSSTLAPSASQSGLQPQSRSRSKPGGRDYVSLSPLLIVPKWDDVARPLDYATLVPGYVKPPPLSPTQSVEAQQQEAGPQEPLLDADGFPVTPVPNALASTAALLPATPAPAPLAVTCPVSALAAASSPFAPTSPDPGMTAVRSRRAQLDAMFNAQLDEENFEGSASARKKELRRRRHLASIPSPIKPGPSVFQLQKAATLKKSYVKFVAATKDPHQIVGAVSAQQPESVSGRKNKQAYLQSILQPTDASLAVAGTSHGSVSLALQFQQA